MINKHHNPDYSAGIPLSVGDRYYAQDLHRDYYYLMDRLGLTVGDLAEQTKVIISGGRVTQVIGADEVDITACVAYIKESVTLPDDFGAAIPPTTVAQDVEFLRVESTAQSNLAVANVGATDYYVKLAYSDTNLNDRNRARKPGSYYYERSPSFTISVDTTPPTAYEILLAIYTGAGPTNPMVFKTNLGGMFVTQNFSLGHDRKRNYFINPDFDIWQRGTSIAVGPAAELYTADRWTLEESAGAAAVVTASRQAFTYGQVDVPDEPEYYMRLTATANSPTAYLKQLIENVRSFAGRRLYISFYAKASAAMGVSPIFYQDFGAGGSGDVSIPTSGQPVSTSWKRIQMYQDIPSISGKTIGAGNHFRVELWVGMTVGQTFEFSHMQIHLAPNSKPSPWENREYEEDLALCQRYFSKSYNPDVDPAAATAIGSRFHYQDNHANSDYQMQLDARFPVTMRGDPTMAVYDDAGNGGVGGAARCTMETGNNIAATIINAAHNSFEVNGSNGGVSTTRELRFHWTADAEL